MTSAAASLQNVAAKPPSNTTHAGLLLQRQCACGTPTASLTGECSECASKKFLQPKLMIGASNDPLEQEADRVAAQVMATPVSGAVSTAPPPIQRLVQQPTGQIDVAPGSLSQVLASPGSLLEPVLLRDMGQRFGYDFSKVRVHSGAAAERSARDVNAQAYTVGQHIVFGAGSFPLETIEGQRLLAHELTHVVQQSGSDRMINFGQTNHDHAPSPSPMSTNALAPAAYSVRIIDAQGNEKFVGPPIPEVLGAAVGAPGQVPEEETAAGFSVQRASRGGPMPMLFIQRTATFTKPVPKAEDPLVRMMKGLTPGLTTPSINGTDQPVKALQPTNVRQTGKSGANVSCQFDSFNIATTAEVIVASPAPAGGWTATIGPASGISSEPKCAKVAKLPITMNAPNNADFVKLVRKSEDEHVADLKWLHDRYFVPYDAFVNGLRGSGKDLPSCGQDLVGKSGYRHMETGFEFSHGWAASVEKLDGPLGTHTDTATINTNPGCTAATLTVGAPAALKPRAGPGNVAAVNPTVTNFQPAKLKVVGNNLKEDKTLVKSFSNAADANAARAVIQHYGMTSRNVIGPLEYFLVGGAAPSGTFKGANEIAIDPKSFQVTFNFPNAGEWTITDISAIATGINANLIASFGANRDQAYSAWSILHAFGFIQKCWIGGTREKPEMTYFRV